MSSRDKSLKKRLKPVAFYAPLDELTKEYGECKAEFIMWASEYYLDISGLHTGNLCRPAACAWAAWQAAWKPPVVGVPNV